MRLASKLLLFPMLLFLLQEADAELLFYEGFDYPVGQELGELSSAEAWDNDKREFTIVEGSLGYPGLKAPTGNRVKADATLPSFDSVRTLTDRWAPQAEGALYVSFLLRLQSVAGVGGTGDGTSLLTVGDTSNNAELLGLNLLNDGATRLGVVKYPSRHTADGAAAFFASGPGASLSVDGSATYLVVARYEWVEGATNDVVTLWVNPATLGAGEDPGNSIAVSNGTDGIKGAGRLTLCRGPNVSIDELRIGRTWADVTPAEGLPPRFLVLVGVLACGLVAAGLWIRQLLRKVEERSAALEAQVRERQAIEQQRLMDQERARIARDLHDELGADITEISMLATRARDDPGGGEERARCLEHVGEKSGQLVAKLEEIVWAMNPEHDSLGALVSYFTFYADRFLGLAGIQLAVETSDDAANLAVEAQVRHQLFLVFKEALANVVRHSGASEVRLAVRDERHTLHVQVADNGCGLATQDAGSGSHEGMANMRRRMENLGGQVDISGEQGRGTTVHFSVPLKS